MPTNDQIAGLWSLLLLRHARRSFGSVLLRWALRNITIASTACGGLHVAKRWIPRSSNETCGMPPRPFLENMPSKRRGLRAGYTACRIRLNSCVHERRERRFKESLQYSRFNRKLSNGLTLVKWNNQVNTSRFYGSLTLTRTYLTRKGSNNHFSDQSYQSYWSTLTTILPIEDQGDLFY